MRQKTWSVAHLPMIRPMGIASLVFLYLPLLTVLVFSFNKSAFSFPCLFSYEIEFDNPIFFDISKIATV